MTTNGPDPPTASAVPAALRHTSPLPAPAAGQSARSPWLAVALIAGAAFGVEMAVSARYGYVRDELYFLAAGHHPAFGYVDQPPLTPVLARVTSAVTGNTLVGLRVMPALALAAMVLLTAAMSRQLGAGRVGQIFAALATATCGEYLGAMHELTTTTPDFVFWTVTLLLAVRMLATQNPRWWIAIGACVGVGSEAKWNIGFLAAALAAAFLATDARHLLRSRYLLIGCVLAAGLAAPDLIWQALHGWPSIAVFRSLQGAAWHNRSTYWIAQVLFAGPALTPIWVAGLVWSLRSKAARPFRPVALACIIVIAGQFVLGGKPYYPGAAYTFLFAAGSVPLEGWLARRTASGSRMRPALLAGAVILAGAAIGLPVSLPVVPARALHSVPLQKINYDLGETISWPREVALVARLYGALPRAERQRTTILTANYGEAGAIDRYGPGLGLPQAYSGGNNFWLWGPPPAADSTAIAVNAGPALLRREFTHVRLIATFWNGLGVSDDEQGAQIYLATGLKSPWARAWGAFRDYS
ncbi:MAG TPA: glycosyltransferase family 39 protein [Streptosporangiaceae bacterium]|nr:glycosyltransferase family 39 protein [Streptosporangiaceae bacterium]